MLAESGRAAFGVPQAEVDVNNVQFGTVVVRPLSRTWSSKPITSS
jgi:hypothetical protein